MLRTGLLLSILTLPCVATPSNEIDVAAVDAVFARWNHPDTPGCALAIVRDGEIVYEKGYGVANFEYDVPITPNSVFRIGSTSKQITAACVLLLEFDGALSLDDDVRRYVPELPEYEHTITLRHLMHHTSGLKDYLGLMGEAGIRFDDSCSTEEALELLAEAEVDFAPGEKHIYSNSGYLLLAVVAARVSGRSTRELARERIFEPLGMEDTHFHDDHREIVRNRAVGYGRSRKHGWYRLLTNVDTVGDGGVFTTVRDFFLWDQNFYHRRVGGDALHEALHTRGVLNDGTKLDYACGLMLGRHRGLPIVQHGGGFVGYRAEMIRFPEQRFSVICFANVASFNPTARCFEVADICLRGEYPRHERIALELQDDLDRLREEAGFPGATFGFVLGDGSGQTLATGFRDLGGKRRMRPDDRMLTGGIGRTFVAACALELAAAGKLDLDDPISRWLGEREWFERLPLVPGATLRQLLSHRSGFPPHVFLAAFSEAVRQEPDRVWEPEELVARILDDRTPPGPGEGFAFLDLDYLLARLILEAATGRSWYELCREHFLEPYQLERTIPADSRKLPGLVPGFLNERNQFGVPSTTISRGELFVNPQFAWFGGGLASTGFSLARWAHLLYGGEVLPPELLAQMLDVRRTGTPPVGGEYGLGVMARDTTLGRGFGHSGWFPGYRSEMLYLPEHGLALGLQINTDDPARLRLRAEEVIEELAARIVEELGS